MPTSHFKPSIEAYLAQRDVEMRSTQTDRLLTKARTAVAWGVPDNESTGYSHSELTNLISQLINHIERLELCLKQTQSNK